MKAITFYSYKGGVGRTLALANIAVYVSRFGQNVCLVDFDLEAPGLLYKFPEYFSTSPQSGLVDYIHEFTAGGNIPASLGEYILTADGLPESQGFIKMIPAGNIHSAQYWKKLASIDWHDLFYSEKGEGVPFFLEFKEKIREEINPDFLLFDSRTGITEMSGICTTLLPDQVVFFITHNPENKDGSRQILRGIQKAKRLKKQDPIKVHFVLTRIPFPGEDKDKEVEKNIITGIRSFLNEDTENLTEHLNIDEISILHSDRELELAESLHLTEKNVKERPLYQDYLKLFSRIIPENMIKPYFDQIVSQITQTDRMLEEPDRVQQELEALVTSYPHPKSYEKLIDFYLLRNVDPDRILECFADLWQIVKKPDRNILNKFIQTFKKKNYFGSIEKIHLKMAEEYLRSNPSDRVEMALKLAGIYNDRSQYKEALSHYLNVIDRVKNKEEILEEILKILIHEQRYDEALNVYQRFKSIVLNSVSLKALLIEILYELGKIEEIKELLGSDEKTEEKLIFHNPSLFANIMKRLNREDEIDSSLHKLLNKLVSQDDWQKLTELGRAFYQLDKKEEFKNALPEGYHYKKRILQRLDFRSSPVRRISR